MNEPEIKRFTRKQLQHSGSCQTWPEDQILDEEAHAPCLLTPQPGSCRIPFGIPQPGN